MKILKTLTFSALASLIFSPAFAAPQQATTQTEMPTAQATMQTTAQTAQHTAEAAVMAEKTAPVIIGDKLNINTATATEIQKALIGIGAKKADAIIQYREKHGPFTAAEQLMEVQGIGKATFEKNRDRIIL